MPTAPWIRQAAADRTVSTGIGLAGIATSWSHSRLRWTLPLRARPSAVREGGRMHQHLAHVGPGNGGSPAAAGVVRPEAGRVGERPEAGGVGDRPGAGRVGEPPEAGRLGGDSTGRPLLMSKLTVPGLPNEFVERPRLAEILDAGARGPVTLLTAPPGWGKTVALDSWVRTSRTAVPVAWLTLEPGDGGSRFWSYLHAALMAAERPASEERTRLLHSATFPRRVELWKLIVCSAPPSTDTAAEP